MKSRPQLELVRRCLAVGQTVAGLAHWIKNILHGLKGGSYLVDVGIAKKNEQKLRKGWDMIKRSIERTSNLVMDLLSYSKEREPEYEDTPQRHRRRGLRPRAGTGAPGTGRSSGNSTAIGWFARTPHRSPHR
jgi:signal transduction histidine kinase